MAQAVKRLWPDTKVAIGPAIDAGFYYDFDKKEPFGPNDLKKIEKTMRRIIQENIEFVRTEMSRADALSYFKEKSEDYKVELIQDLPDETLSVYTDGDFVDLCKGPHIESTGQIKAFALTHIAGAYWRGSEQNQMLQRIYGTAFPTREELDEHLKMIEEAKKRDHRKLGKELGLFLIDETAGAARGIASDAGGAGEP